MTISSSPARIHGLDTLRALAIVLVVLHHYVLFVSHANTFGWVGDIGWVGVDLFFALSGYLIGNQIFAAMRSPQGLSLGNFYGRRLLRTLPNYYCVLALYFLSPAWRDNRQLPPLWEFLTFTQNIYLAPGTAFSHAWSLCIEEQFYLLLPACALAIALCRSLRSALRLAWTAIAAAFVMGLGTAITVASIAVIAVTAKGLARRLAGGREGRGALVMRGLEFGAAGLVFLFGVGLLLGYVATERVTCF